MGSSEPHRQIPAGVAYPAASVALDPDFDIRWGAWIERGRVHEQRVRRRFLVWASVFAMGAAIVYAVLIS